MRLLITGSTGFLGGSMGRFAAAAGHEVFGIARRSQADADWPGTHISADVAIADLATIVQNVKPDFIFHGAGTASVAGSFAAPLDDIRAAVVTFANLLDGVRRSGLKPLVIFPSSAAVYGNPAILPITENAPANPISPYGFHKLVCELHAKEYSTCFGLDTLVLRLFSVFGPAQRRLLLWEIYSQLVSDQPSVKLQGSGHESRDYLYVDDLCAAVLALAANRLSGHHIFNLASGIETRISDLAEQMKSMVRPTKHIEWLNRQLSGDPVRWCADMSKLCAQVPRWKPEALSTRLAATIRQWQAGL